MTHPCTDLRETFWMPDYCPVARRTIRNRLDALVDAEAVEWHGGRYCTAHYRCPCCGATWSDDGWPVVMLFGADTPPSVFAERARP